MPSKRIRNVSDASSSYYSCDSEENERKSGRSTGSSPTCQGRRVSKRPCLNKNALMARANRQRKKEYVEELEKQSSTNQQEIESLKNQVLKYKNNLKRASAEVIYLRNVLKNQSNITTMLETMNQILSSKGKEKPKNVQQNLQVSPVNIFSIDDPVHQYDPSLVGQDDHNYCGDSPTDEEPNLNSTIPDSGASSSGESSTEASESSLSDYLDVDMDQLNSPANLLGSLGSDMFSLPSTIMEEDDDTTIFDNLDSPGTCLHFSSGRVSLQYCLYCQSKNNNTYDT